MTIILDHDDCGWVATLTTLDTRQNNSNTVATRRFVAYIQRQATPSRQMILCERLATGLSPSLGTLPGPMEGIIQLDAGVNEIIVTYTGRIEGDTAGPFKLQETRVPVLGIYPLDLAAAQRVRGIARIVSKYLPAAAGELISYTK